MSGSIPPPGKLSLAIMDEPPINKKRPERQGADNLPHALYCIFGAADARGTVFSTLALVTRALAFLSGTRIGEQSRRAAAELPSLSVQVLAWPSHTPQNIVPGHMTAAHPCSLNINTGSIERAVTECRYRAPHYAARQTRCLNPRSMPIRADHRQGE
jgi:hypothetical protein